MELHDSWIGRLRIDDRPAQLFGDPDWRQSKFRPKTRNGAGVASRSLTDRRVAGAAECIAPGEPQAAGLLVDAAKEHALRHHPGGGEISVVIDPDILGPDSKPSSASN